jgi:hypothetical protein
MMSTCMYVCMYVDIFVFCHIFVRALYARLIVWFLNVYRVTWLGRRVIKELDDLLTKLYTAGGMNEWILAVLNRTN